MPLQPMRYHRITHLPPPVPPLSRLLSCWRPFFRKNHRTRHSSVAARYDSVENVLNRLACFVKTPSFHCCTVPTCRSYQMATSHRWDVRWQPAIDVISESMKSTQRRAQNHDVPVVRNRQQDYGTESAPTKLQFLYSAAGLRATGRMHFPFTYVRRVMSRSPFLTGSHRYVRWGRKTVVWSRITFVDRHYHRRIGHDTRSIYAVTQRTSLRRARRRCYHAAIYPPYPCESFKFILIALEQNLSRCKFLVA